MTERRTHRSEADHGPVERRGADSADPLVDFLAARLTEELAQLWERDERRGAAPAPGLAAQLAVVDELLVTLGSGRLPARRELRMLLLGYGHHPDYDPAWVGRANRLT